MRHTMQTFIKQMSKHTALEPEKKLQLASGSSLTFGALKCRVTFGPSASEVSPCSSADSIPGGPQYLAFICKPEIFGWLLHKKWE